MSEEPRHSNPWFAARRSLAVRELLADFCTSYHDFLEIHRAYTASGKVDFAQIDRLVGTENRKGLLWRLKDSCHRLWREERLQGELSGCQFDWVVGSLFHEAMKLKEDAYVLQYYGPMAEEIIQRRGGKNLGVSGMEYRRLMERTAREIGRLVENLGGMFGRANYLLRMMMAEQADNAILLRYLIEDEEVVVQLWSESVIDLFRDIFAGAPEEGFVLAAESYQKDHWLRQALATYARALEINPHRTELRLRVWSLQAILRGQAGSPADMPNALAKHPVI